MNQDGNAAGRKNYNKVASPQSRKSYEAPKLIRIGLRPEEAVLGHCKTSGATGPISSSCISTGCMAPGS